MNNREVPPINATHKPVHIVLTTIHMPHVLHEYQENIRMHGHLEQVKIWIVGDKKTPVQTTDIAGDLSAKGLSTVFLDVDTQAAWGCKCMDFYSRLGFNDETRRNIGYLSALENGCDILISIDDDNFPGAHDFVGSHMKTGKPWDGPMIAEPSGFYNICEHLDIAPPRPVYPRGFPFLLRDTNNTGRQISSAPNARIGVNTGLWTSAPDIDAVTWLNGPVVGNAYTGDDTTVLSQQTWMPVNGQNVSVTRDLIPAYLCVPMGWPVPGGKIQRYGDIWGGYFLQAIMQDTGFHAAFGTPVVDHRRNPHNYMNDLRTEYWGMMLTDWLVNILKSDFHPSATPVTDRVRELSTFLADTALPALPSWCPEEMTTFFRWTCGNLSAWADACDLFL
ncbi:MAG: hypothetical protein SWH61_13995 [Thermodesulfobacteriota bacterium]|nr:hypothetical protein [Thermodesulfobacteriota bacterium]